MKGRSRTFWIWLSAACAGGLAVRLVYVFVANAHNPLGGDAYYYNGQAALVAAGKGFADPYTYLYHHRLVPSADHPPLLTTVLAVADKTGLSSLGSHKVVICVLGVLTVAVVALAARVVAGDRAGVIAALLGAFYPGFWIHDGQILSEQLAMLAVGTAVLLTYWFWRRPRPALAMGVGVACGAAALSRSELVLLVPLLAAPLGLLARDARVRRRLALAAVCVVTALATMAPWVVRNMVTFEHPVYLSSQLGGTLAVANCDRVYYGPVVGSWDYYCGANLHLPAGDESVVSQQFGHVATTYIDHHLSRVPVVVAARVGRTWSVFQPLGQNHIDLIDGYPLWASELRLYCFYVLAIGAIAGVVVLRRRRVPVFPLLSVALAVTIGVMVTYGSTRFRAPAEVTVVILAAVAVDALFSLRRPRRGAETARESQPDVVGILAPAARIEGPTEVSP